jgi:multidrug transporter EmrE-like cation transporter
MNFTKTICIFSSMSVLLLSVSCSTMKKSIFYGGLSGASLGIVGGSILSPNKDSVAPNMAIWGSVGALVGATLGYLFFTDDPENRDLPSMIPGRGQAKYHSEDLAPINKIESITINPLDSKKYKIESEPLPDHLKGKVQTPFIIEHEIPERVEHLENGKAITVERHKAWEVDYE